MSMYTPKLHTERKIGNKMRKDERAAGHVGKLPKSYPNDGGPAKSDVTEAIKDMDWNIASTPDLARMVSKHLRRKVSGQTVIDRMRGVLKTKGLVGLHAMNGKTCIWKKTPQHITTRQRLDAAMREAG